MDSCAKFVIYNGQIVYEHTPLYNYPNFIYDKKYIKIYLVSVHK